MPASILLLEFQNGTSSSLGDACMSRYQRSGFWSVQHKARLRGLLNQMRLHSFGISPSN
jgi:hypothetical protein